MRFSKLNIFLIIVVSLLYINSYGACRKEGPCNDVGSIPPGYLPPSAKSNPGTKSENKPKEEVKATNESARALEPLPVAGETIKKPSHPLRLTTVIVVCIALAFLAFKLLKTLSRKK